MRHHLSSLSVLCALFASLAVEDGRAQVVLLSGNVSDGAGGPLRAGVVYHALTGFAVPSGATLTVAPGAIIKFGPGTLLDVFGTLLVNGTAANRAIFTSLPDDSAGGDTNGDGPSVGLPGDYLTMRFQDASDNSVLTGTVVRFSGGSGFPGVLLLNANIRLQSCDIANCGFDALRLQGDPRPTVVGCRFLDNLGVAVNTSLDAIPGFLDNVASRNAGGNYQRVNPPTISADRTIGPANLLNSVLVLANNADVPLGRTLTLQAGVIVKPLFSTIVDVNGTLLAQGTAAQPVVFTSFTDDAHGGDTNGDGPSVGTPGQWLGIRCRPTSAAIVLDEVLVRYAGAQGFPGVLLQQSDVVLRHSTIQACAVSGMQLQGSRPTVRNCVFRDCGSTAVIGAGLDALPGFLSNSASGNTGGDFIDVTGPSPTNSCTISRSNLLGNVLVLGTVCTIPSGVTVTLEEGVIVKPRSPGFGLFVDGSLNVLGTSYQPVVFTSFADDVYGGDTNKDGPSTGTPADWLTLRYNTPANTSRCEHALLRFGGSSGAACFQNHSTRVSIRSVRTERAATHGFYLTAHATNVVPNLVAWANGGDGFHLGGGPYEVQYSTAASNGGAGFRGVSPNLFVGNSISWSNAGGNVVGTGCVNCNAVNPVFRNEAIGDLQLTHNGPMVDQGDVPYALGIVSDFLENPRILDDDLNSVAVPDLGAYELCWWDMVVDGEAQPGQTLTYHLAPHLPFTGLSVFVFGVLDGTLYLNPWGILLVGTSPLVLGSSAISAPFALTLPDTPSIVGLQGAVQSLAWPAQPLVHPTLTRVHRFRVRP